MAYKTILVHIDDGKRWPARLEAAIGLARRFDAKLIGLNALTPIELPGYVLAGTGGASIANLQKQSTEEQAARAKAAFEKVASAAGFANAEWRTSRRDAVAAVTLHARYADLVVLGQPSDEDTGVAAGFAEDVVLEGGRPVLMLPYMGNFAAIGKRALVCWNASREATRAVTDAIPLLREAESARVIVINPKPGEHGAMPGSDIALFLARHGVSVEVQVDKAVEIDVGNEILSRAADFGADLIVMGAYGQSRLREFVMGGASRTIIASMTVPVLLSN